MALLTILIVASIVRGISTALIASSRRLWGVESTSRGRALTSWSLDAFSFSSANDQYSKEEKIDRLVQWADYEECEGVDSIRVGKDALVGRRGLYAGTTSFATEDYILAIPFPATLLVRDSLDAENEFNERFLEIDPEVLEGYSFLQKFCRGPSANRWKAYIETLPRPDGPNFDPTPDFWDEADIRQLQIPRLVEESIRRKRDIASMALATETNSDLLQWAVWIIRSRGFTTLKLISSQQESSGAATATTNGTNTVHSRTSLIPILDLVNHVDDPNAEIEVVEAPDRYNESFFALRATKSIQKGDEITIAYGTGHETSLDLFSKYGFWTANNRADKYLDWLSAVDARWTTTLQGDHKKLLLLETNSGSPLHTILSLRIHLKELQQQS